MRIFCPSFFIFILFLGLEELQAQKVLLSEEPAADTVQLAWGQNRKHYAHVFMGFYFPTPPETKGGGIVYGLSNEFDLGLRYKYKLSKFCALGTELYYQKSVFNIRQNSKKLLPNSILHEKERYILNSAGLSVFQRINFGRRGNILGKYIDLGVQGLLHIASRYHVRDKVNGPSKLVDSYYKNPNYIQNFQYGIFLRAGWNNFALEANYRLSDMFSKINNSSLPETPSLSVGLDIALAFRN